MYLLKIVVEIIGAFLFVAIVIVLIAALRFSIQIRPRRGREPGFEYIYVEDDGSARELNTAERECISAEFLPGDGARPYIKLRYEELTPDGRLSGFLRRRRLPKGITVRRTLSDEQ